jgi:hypothetical protein
MGGRWSGRQLHKLLHLCFEPLVLMRVFREGYNREGGQWRVKQAERESADVSALFREDGRSTQKRQQYIQRQQSYSRHADTSRNKQTSNKSCL